MSDKRAYPLQEKTYDLADTGPTEEVKKVLMLEDEVEFSEMLKTFLISQSFEVTCVANGTDGLRHIMATDFDIILCDMVMPTLPGDKFYLAVERTKPHLCKRFIFMTGHRADPKWDAFIRKIKGIMLWKPFAMSDLLATIQTVIKKSQAVAGRPD